jgi:hypothetical protein
MTQPDAAISSSPGTPAWASFAFTFLNSVGTFVVTSGIFYLTDATYRFSTRDNYLLGVLLGITYIAGALGAGPLLRALRTCIPTLSSRAVLAAMMLLMALLCLLPIAALSAATPPTPPTPDRPPGGWPIWVLVLLYSPLTGILWPMVESYVSGGIAGAPLRRRIGLWNVCWSSALIAASLLIAPLVKNHAALAIALLGIVHLAAAACLLRFSREPDPHPHEDAHLCPPIFTPLLVTFRMLLPMSYLVSSALLPFLPALLKRLGVEVGLVTIVGAAWLTARTATFFLLQAWGGWHGRWYPAILAPALLLLGFGIAVMSANLGLGLPALILGLAIFGIGMAGIYSGALYYAMEVGRAEVSAGGTHEALIGVGYAGGPSLGLLVTLAVSFGILSDRAFEPVVLGVVAAVALLVAITVARRVSRLSATPA